MRKSVLFILILFSAIAKADFAQKPIEEFPSPFSDLEAVVQVTNMWNGRGGRGTGTLVSSEGLIYTCLHCVEGCLREHGVFPDSAESKNARGNTCAEVDIDFFYIPKPMTVHFPVLVDYGSLELGNHHGDYAILKIDMSVFGDGNKPHPPRLHQTVRPGTRVVAMGFPALIVNYDNGQQNFVGRNVLYFTSGSVFSGKESEDAWKTAYEPLKLPPSQYKPLYDLAKMTFFDRADQYVFHDAATVAGFSGGPLFDENYDLVGVVWGAIPLWDASYGDFPDELNLHKTHLRGGLLSAMSLSFVRERVWRATGFDLFKEEGE